MTYTLGDIQTLVRQTLDVDAVELPSSLINVWAREGSRRVERQRRRWPFYDHEWTLELVVDQDVYPFTDFASASTERVDQIDDVRVDQDRRLRWISREAARAQYDVSSGTGNPIHWRARSDQLYVYPTPASVETLIIQGSRKPIDWVANGVAAEPDMPDEMQDIIYNWVLGRAYQQQEDPDMGLMYMDMADETLRSWAAKVEETPGDQPLVLGEGYAPSGGAWASGRLRYSWE